MKKFIILLLLAYVTQYGWTGKKMANGMYPFVGAVACPRYIPLGRTIRILGTSYVCADRTNLKYNGRFDVFSLGTKESMMQWGKRKLDIEILD